MPARRLVAVLAAAAAAALALGSGIAPGQRAGSKKVLFAVMTGAKEVGTNGERARAIRTVAARLVRSCAATGVATA
jgi:hypothetical protein